jgi:tryptophanase
MKAARSDSLVLVSGWSDNGWLSGGHAVRMALELCELCLVTFVICSKYRVQLCTRPGQSFIDAWKAIKFRMDQKTGSSSLRLALGSVSTFSSISESLFPFETPRCLIVCKIGCRTVPAGLLS